MTDVVEENGNDIVEENIEETENEEFIENPFKRAFMVLFSPRVVFESVAKKSTRLDWIIPITLSVIFTLIFINTGFDYIRNDQLNAAVERIENNTELSDEQKAAQIEKIEAAMEKMGGFTRIISNASAVIGSFVSIAVIAMTLLAITNLMLRAELSFDNTFKIAALGSMTGIVGSVIRLPLLFYMESVSQTKLSLMSLLPDGMGESFLIRIFDIDIFMLWYAVIISIGMAVFAKTSFIRAFIPVCIMWLIYRAALLSISGALSGFGG